MIYLYGRDYIFFIMASDSRRRRSWWTLLLIPLALAFYPSTRSLQADDTKQLPIEDHALCSSTPTGTIETTLCDYESVDTANDKLVLNLKELVQTPFFRYFRIDLYRECPFWHDNGLCMSRDCAITSVDEVRPLQFSHYEIQFSALMIRVKYQKSGEQRL